jgi:hypothetical protein
VSVGILLCKVQDKDSAFFTIALYMSVGILLCRVQDKDSAFFTIASKIPTLTYSVIVKNAESLS